MPQVLLLHGIWNARGWMLPLAMRLRQQHFQTWLFGYDSVYGGAEKAVDALLRRIDVFAGQPLVLVGHSLGGLVALQAVRRGAAVERVVCLGSPLRGSATARALSRRRGSSWVLGRSRALLLDGVSPWEHPVEVGVIAGSRAHGLGRWLVELGDSDGTVAVAETRLPGLTDHCVVPASHAGMLLSPAVARQTVAFLRDGRFDAG